MPLEREGVLRGYLLFSYPRSFRAGVPRIGLAKQEDGQWRRISVEKPFGADLQSARQLNRNLLDVVCDDQILRIDHV
jgi:glucose-6-phosphate 1-dehydrogenase